MKYKIKNFLEQEYPDVDFDVFYPPEGFGDYSTNVAFILAKKEGKNPQGVAQELVEKLKKEFSEEFEEIKAEKNGFINFYLSKDYLIRQLKEILENDLQLTTYNLEPLKINLEFVSANPTGPLTLGNARTAAFGDALANILERVGHKVTREYYINDIGNQIDILEESVKRRLKELEGEDVDFPEEFYQGEYIIDLAREAKEKKVAAGKLKEFVIEKILDEIRTSLANFGVKFDVWFKESVLKEKKEVDEVLQFLKTASLTYEEDGALWFKATDFGLDKDVVLVKAAGQARLPAPDAAGIGGQGTYLLSDFAYAKNKLSRGFDLNIYILGADHHEDVKRLEAGIRALNLPEEKFVFLLHQLVALKKGEALLRMSKRKALFITLDDLLKQISKDVSRYFFLEKSLDTHLDFDLELAKEEASKNPVFYIQYAFARIHSVFEKSEVRRENEKLDLLKEEEELDLIRKMIRFPEIIFEISQNYQVHQLPHFTLELASLFHKFYEKHRIISEDQNLTQARLALVKAFQNILKESLTLMGIEAPEKM